MLIKVGMLNSILAHDAMLVRYAVVVCLSVCHKLVFCWYG